jgi:hypothetical protein
MLVVEVYNKAEWEIQGGDNDTEGRARKSELLSACCFESLLMMPVSPIERLIELLREFPSEEPTRKRYIQEIIGWSGRHGPLERGDAELHHAVGSVYAEG